MICVAKMNNGIKDKGKCFVSTETLLFKKVIYCDPDRKKLFNPFLTQLYHLSCKNHVVNFVLSKFL